MPEEVNINLGSNNSDKTHKRSCFDGVCPPNPRDIIGGIMDQIPMILGVMLTMMKMDQFQRPLANTAEEMIEGLVPQVEKNATKIGDIYNSLTEASHRVSSTMKKHDYDFTTDDKVHLVKLLMEEDNYLDSYDAVIDFIKYQRPGFIKALYKNLVVNAEKPHGITTNLHAESEIAKEHLEDSGLHHKRPGLGQGPSNDKIPDNLDDHIKEARAAIFESKRGYESRVTEEEKKEGKIPIFTEKNKNKVKNLLSKKQQQQVKSNSG